MTHPTLESSPFTIGLDVGDRKTDFCVLRGRQEVVTRGKTTTTCEGLDEALAQFPGASVVLEAGSQSPWLSRHLKSKGFAVLVADPRRVQLLSKDPRKTDRRDAEMLARMAFGFPELLGEIVHRGEQAQADLALVRVRDQLVSTRTTMVQCARGTCKAMGVRLPSTSTEAFGKKVRALVPAGLGPALVPLLEQIESLTASIRDLDKKIAALSERYPEMSLLQQVNGVGPITAAAFVLTIEDPHRFKDSRKVGSWLGLCPRNHASGDSDPDLPISKSGDAHVRRLLVQCAQYALGPFGKDSDLRRFGERLQERGGRAAKKKAITAVARKLAVLLHHLWRSGSTYDPLHNAKRQAATKEATVQTA